MRRYNNKENSHFSFNIGINDGRMPMHATNIIPTQMLLFFFFFFSIFISKIWNSHYIAVIIKKGPLASRNVISIEVKNCFLSFTWPQCIFPELLSPEMNGLMINCTYAATIQNSDMKIYLPAVVCKRRIINHLLHILQKCEKL